MVRNFLRKSGRTELLFLTLLLVVAGFFRLYQLGKVPPGVGADEAAFGYNAYSIHHIGRDEWGKRYPLIFRSFGDYKLPGLVYLTSFLLNFFSLSLFVVRLPSALSGFLGIIGIFFILKEFFPKDKYSPLLGAAIFAFSPWPFNISRLYFESSVALGFFIFGILFFLRFINRGEKIKRLDGNIFLAVFFLALTNYFYVAYRLATGLLLVTTVLFFLIKKRSSVRVGLLVLGLYFFFILPIFPQFFSSAGRTRLRQQTRTLNSDFSLEINEKRALCYLGFNRNARLTKLCYAFWNKPVLRVEKTAKSWLAHFSSGFLFLGGARDGYEMPSGKGGFYFFLFPCYLLGLFALASMLVRGEDPKKNWLFLTLGLLLTPLPASLVGTPSFFRSTPLLPFLIITIVLGIKVLSSFLDKRLRARGFTAILVLTFLLMASFRYLINYFLIFTKRNDRPWHADVVKVMEYVKENQDRYQRIIFSDLDDNAIILVAAFFQKTDPRFFLENVERGKPSDAGVTYITKIGKYEQGNFNIEGVIESYDLQGEENVLFITTPISKYSRFADQVIYDRYHSLRLAEIYDIGHLKKKLKPKLDRE